MVKANWWRPIPALMLLVAATTLSAFEGAPDKLPGAALGWPLLLHLERAVILVAGLAMVALVGVRATLGRFPNRLGQLEYPTRSDIAEFDEAARFDGERLDALEAALASLGAELSSRQQI